MVSVSGSQNAPNPGYLGPSSHVTLFSHLQPRISSCADYDTWKRREGWPDNPEQEAKISHGAKLIEQFFRSSHAPSWVALVKRWTSSGVNLALAGLFTESCAETVQYILDKLLEDLQDETDIARNLFAHSSRPLATDSSSTIEDLCSNFCKRNARWETIGLFFAAVSRATGDLKRFGDLYASEQQRRSVQRLALHYSDRCVDISLSLDSLNDLQLLLQYENWIAHASIDGDQSMLFTSYPIEYCTNQRLRSHIMEKARRRHQLPLCPWIPRAG